MCSAAADRLRFEGEITSVHLPEKEEADKTGFNDVDDAWKKLLASGNSAYLELEAVPEQAGKITALDFDFGDRSQEDFFDAAGVLNHDSASVTHPYTKPGTYFAAVRVKMQRTGDSDALFTQVLNLARARVIVEE